MKKIAIFSLIIGLSMGSLFAQSDIDAFLFSQNDWSGTARFCGAGGAFGAVGAEYSALSTNPASIGVYKKSEVTFTPLVVSIMKSNSSYNDRITDYLSSNYNLGNLGVVFTFDNFKNPTLKGLQFGFGYNRVKDFNNEFRIEGASLNSSMMDEYVNAANAAGSLNEFNTNLAWNTWLIDTANSHYWSPLEKQSLYQTKYVHTSGAIDEMNFSFGGNCNDQFYFGATIGVPFLNYNEQVTYTEDDDLDSIGGFKSFTANGVSKTESIGINFKIGLLYQPVDFLRFGLAFHTPTYYGKVKNSYSNDISSTFNDEKYSDESPDGYYHYKLTTPLRVMGNIAFFIKKRAFISAEYEYVNYAMASLYTYGSNRYSFSDENQAIKDKYKAQHVLRVGGEMTVTDPFLIRLGYCFKSSPYKDNINNGSSHTGSIGLGFRTKQFFCDVTYQLQRTKELYWIYNPVFVNSAENTYYFNRIMATVGFKF
ncbi:MAG: outer membrane protein transport protein [Bacteroidales bacterium]|nr:outer membrane protein transport protein [Bacteroidales bacterium]